MPENVLISMIETVSRKRELDRLPPCMKPSDFSKTNMTTPFVNENTALLPLIRQALVAQDAQWLTTMTREGLLDAPLRNADPHLVEVARDKKMQESLDRWHEVCMAVVDFLDQIKPKPRHDPSSIDAARMDIDVAGVAGFECGNLFKEWFAEAIVRVLGHIQSIAPPVDGSKKILGQWAMAACVLDLPDTLRAIGSACPAALRATIDHDNLGSFLKEDAAMGGFKMRVHPMYLALQLSRVACMQVIREVSGDSEPMMGYRLNTSGFQREFIPFSLADNLSIPSFGPVCSEHAFTHALHSLSSQKDKVHVVQTAALKSMTPDTAWNMQQYVPAFIASGAYDAVASKAAEGACERGFVSVLQRIKGRVCWDEVRDGVLLETLELCSLANNIDTTAAAHVFLTMAIEDGYGDKFAKLEIKNNRCNNTNREPRLEPLSEAIKRNAFGVVRSLLEFNGISPSEPMAPGLPSAIALAEKHHGELATKLRTMSLRQSAMALIDSMDLESPNARPL